MPGYCWAPRALAYSPGPKPCLEGPTAVHGQLCNLVYLSCVPGSDCKVRLGFKALLISLCYHISMLAALKLLSNACSCSSLLSLPIPVSEIPNPDHMWMLKPPSVHEQPLQIGLQIDFGAPKQLSAHVSVMASALCSTSASFWQCYSSFLPPGSGFQRADRHRSVSDFRSFTKRT